jgi:hypothetical protein
MLPAADQGPGALRLKALIEDVAKRAGLRYLYATNAQGKLRHFDSEVEISGEGLRQVWEKLEALGPGTHHLIGHAAEASPELEALCSADHPARYWAAPVRVQDLAFFTSASTRTRLEALGFDLITVADV